MISWRMDLTVLTDLSASMFAACFIILLVFLNLTQERSDRAGPSPTPETIEATEALQVHRQTVLSPAEMVEMLRIHRVAASGISIDVFTDRIELWRAGEAAPLVLNPPSIEIGLSAALPSNGAARLYVFSNTLYNSVARVLDRTALAREEMTVPRALRDADRPNEQWKPAFVHLEAQRLQRLAFRQALAKLLEGSVSGSAEERSSAQGARVQDGAILPDGHVYQSLLVRIRRWLSAFAAIAFPTSGFFVVFWIERGRLRNHSRPYSDPRNWQGAKLM